MSYRGPAKYLWLYNSRPSVLDFRGSLTGEHFMAAFRVSGRIVAFSQYTDDPSRILSFVSSCSGWAAVHQLGRCQFVLYRRVLIHARYAVLQTNLAFATKISRDSLRLVFETRMRFVNEAAGRILAKARSYRNSSGDVNRTGRIGFGYWRPSYGSSKS